MLPGRVRRVVEYRSLIGFIAGGVVGLALVVFVVVVDVTLLAQAYQRAASSTLPAVAIGTGAAFGTVLAFAWYRSSVGRLGTTARRLLGWAGIAWAVSFLVALVWTHPRNRDDASATPLEIAVVSYCLIIVVTAMCLFPIAVLKLARPPTHKPDDRVRVAELRDKKPYFVAYCDCGWVGEAYDAAALEARDSAFRDAHAHGVNVASDVEQPWASPGAS